jgi:PAS domain S-box-containing protein
MEKSDLYSEFRSAALWAAYAVSGIALLTLTGWQFDIALFKRPIPELTGMNPMTAVGCLLSGLSIILIHRNKSYVVVALSVMVILIGVIRLMDILVHMNSEIDLWLYNARLQEESAMGMAVRMAPNTALNFIFSGSALLLSLKDQSKRIANYLAFITAFIGLFIILGYIYFVEEFYGVLRFFPMSIHTAFCFVLIALSIFFTNNRSGFMATITSGYAGGKAARFMFFIILAIPVLFGYLRLWLYWNKPFSVELGVTLLVTAIIAVFYFVAWHLAAKLNKADLRRTGAEATLSAHLRELEIKNAELEKNKELYTKLIGDEEAYAVIVLDTSGYVVKWNKGVEKIKGYSESEIIGKHFSVFYTEEDREKGLPEKYMEEAKRNGRATEEGWRVRKDGTVFWASIVITALYDNNHNLFGFSKFARDLTEKKRIEERLFQFNSELEHKVEERTKEILAQESRFKSLIENSFDIISLQDENGDIVYRSPSYERATGWQKDERIRGTPDGLIHPDDRVQFMQSYKEVMQFPGRPVHVIFRSRHKEGHYIWIDGVMRNMLHDPNLKAIVYNLRDVTEQKEAEIQLLKGYRELSDYKFALDESSIVAITDQKGAIQYVNDYFCKISGYTRSELIGQDHRIINSGHHPKTFIRNLWTTIANGRIWRGELKNRAKDGTYYWVDTTIVPFLNDQGKPYQYVAIRSDITQRKKAEENERRLEEKVRAKSEELAGVFERISDGFIMLDQAFRYTYANKRVGEIVGRDPSSLIGKSVWDEFPDAVGSETYKAFNRAMNEQRYIHHIDYYQPLDLWQENHIYPSPEGLTVFIRDISEQKRAEAKIAKSERIYKTISSSIPGSVICIFDQDYRYLLIEGDMLEKFGYTKETLLGNKAEDVLPPDRFAALREDCKRVFQGEHFNRQIHRYGYDIITRYVPLADENNKVYAVMTVGIDITELQSAHRRISDLNQNLEQKVQERTMQLEQVNKELDSFSYSVSHDLRAPLRAVNGYAKMLEEDYNTIFDGEGKRLLGVIQQNAARMGVLIDDLLAFSRLGRKEINKSMVNMNDLMQKIVDETRRDKGDNTRIIMHDLLPAYGDYSMLSHVMVNLLSNAVKYSSKNPHPVVEISSMEKDGTHIYSIKDNGVGFDMQYASKLFGVFQRLHSHEEFEGTGVGLAIVERIISKHGGKVWANSIPGEGAVFYFSLPYDNN